MEELETPHLILRFTSEVEFDRGQDPVSVLAKTDPRRWEQLRETFGELRFEPVFTAVEPETLRELQEQAVRRDPTYRPEPLDRFFYAEPEKDGELDELAKALRAWETVRSAEVERIGPDPAVNAGDDPRSAGQDHLDAAPLGIDARYAWTFAGGDGAGQRVVDLERGWTFAHEDLVAHGVTLINGSVLDSSRNHGTAVLGEMVASDNTVGGVGIAPNVTSVLATSYSGSSIPNAIVAAVRAMDFGDVLILEAQTDVSTTAVPQYGPIETIDANFEAIRLATALGIVVVEAGGNGTNNGGTPAVNLDTWQNAAGRRILRRDPANSDFRDSGAIIVAAASSAAPHTRLAYSTFGARIDCFGWGENVDTLASDAVGSTTAYTGSFSGTSSASPIVAGAALCLQGVCEANQHFRLSPRQMRAILSDPANNTRPAATETTAMGVLPNLRRIIDNQLNVTPDVYLRDNIADTGEAHNGAISASPDVILRPAPVADPQTAYGQGSGTELNAGLGFEAAAGQDNVIYVRVLNQGTTAAVNTIARVFWSKVSTLVTPNLWTLVGSTTIPSVPVGETLVVSDAIVWPAAQIPGPGHYCFVAVLTTAGDPGPEPTDFQNFDNFQTFVKDNNNVTWRNFNVVDTDPEPNAEPAGFVALPFAVAGTPDAPRSFAVELATRIPRDTELLLEVPLRFIRDFHADLRILSVDERREVATAQLPAGGRVRFGSAVIAAGDVYDLRLLVRFSDPSQGGRIVARQLLEGKEEVGRVTWTMVPGIRDRFQKALGGDPIGALD